MGNLTGRIPTRGIQNPIPTKVTPTISDPLTEYRISDRDNNGVDNFNYYGYLKTDGSYYIMRENISTGAYRYCKGTSGYSTAWANRTTQTYDYFNVIFG